MSFFAQSLLGFYHSTAFLSKELLFPQPNKPYWLEHFLSFNLTLEVASYPSPFPYNMSWENRTRKRFYDLSLMPGFVEPSPRTINLQFRSEAFKFWSPFLMTMVTALVFFVLAVKAAYMMGKFQGGLKYRIECDEEYGSKIIRLEGMSHRERERYFDMLFSRNGIKRKHQLLKKEKEFMCKWLLKSERIEKK